MARQILGAAGAALALTAVTDASGALGATPVAGAPVIPYAAAHGTAGHRTVVPGLAARTAVQTRATRTPANQTPATRIPATRSKATRTTAERVPAEPRPTHQVGASRAVTAADATTDALTWAAGQRAQQAYRLAPEGGSLSPPNGSVPYFGLPVGGLFGSGSVWRQPIGNAPVAADSAAEVAGLAGDVSDRYGGVAAFNAHEYTNSFWTAAAGTPTTDVSFDDCQGKGYTPAGLVGPGGQLTGVPIPAGAVPAAGTDHQLAVWSPATDQLWELWEAQRTTTGWSACWGGRIDRVSTSPGWFTGGFGATATGLAQSGGTLGLAEVRAGVVDHALALQIPDPARAGDVSWPAQRSDGGSSAPHAIPEGTRLRLDPALDVATLPGLTPIGRLVARAAQTYGFVVTDTAGAVAVVAESGAPAAAVTGVDPWTTLEAGVPDYAILAGFPWNHLQAMPKDYGEPPV